MHSVVESAIYMYTVSTQEHLIDEMLNGRAFFCVENNKEIHRVERSNKIEYFDNRRLDRREN